MKDAPSVPVVRLERRENAYDGGKIYYYLRTFRRLTENGVELPESERKFRGGEWRAARKAFREYVEGHPGIIAENLAEGNQG